MNTEEKKIAVIGIGGVGGYIAGLLAKAYPHVTMVARGARAESIRKKGLVLHSDYKGEIVAKPERVVPIQDMGQQDYIFICVKNYSLAEVCESIRDMVTDDTVIIPVMNGVDPGENIRRLVGKGTVVDSLIYTVLLPMRIFLFPSRIRLRGFVLESKMRMNVSRRKLQKWQGS